MGIEVTISGVNMEGDSKLLNNAEINGASDVKMNLNNLQLKGNAKALENLKIQPILEELENNLKTIDKNSSEYTGLQTILQSKEKDKASILKLITEHIGVFTEGILASIIANKLT